MGGEKRRHSYVDTEEKRKLIEENAIRVAYITKTFLCSKPSSSLSGKSPVTKQAKVDDLPTVDQELKETNEENSRKSQPAKNTLTVCQEDGKAVEKKARTTVKQKRKLTKEAASQPAKANKTAVVLKRSSSSSSGKASASKRVKVEDLPNADVNELKETKEKNNSKKSKPSTNALKVRREVGKSVEKKTPTTDEQEKNEIDDAASRAKLNKIVGIKRPSSSSTPTSKRAKVEDLPYDVKMLKDTN